MSFTWLALLLSVSVPAAAAPVFLASPDGETVSDLEADLSLLPSFGWVGDPFLKMPGRNRAPASSENEDGEYKLQATTTFEGEDAVAVVNDQVVRVGDRVGRRTVLKIGQDFVLLGDRGSVIEAGLEPEEKQKESGAEEGRTPASEAAAQAHGQPKKIGIEEFLNQSQGQGVIKIEEVRK